MEGGSENIGQYKDMMAKDKGTKSHYLQPIAAFVQIFIQQNELKRPTLNIQCYVCPFSTPNSDYITISAKTK